MVDRKPEFEPKPRVPKEYEHVGMSLANSAQKSVFQYSPEELRLLGGGNYLTGTMRIIHEIQERSVDERELGNEPRPLQDELDILKPPFHSSGKSHT
jgi:hypothetical protein